MHRWILVAALWLLACSAGMAFANQRLALVIGIDAYKEIPTLARAGNDARAVGAALRELGYEVREAYNPGQRTMSREIEAVRARIGNGDNVFFFFAGHAVEIRGENFLLPADVPSAEVGQEGLVTDTSFSAARIIDRFQEKGARLVVSVLDACRNNPFERRGGRSLNVGRGLTRMESPEGTFTLFSAGARQIALDSLRSNDTDVNSVFTRLLVPRLKQPGLSLVDLAKIVQKEVQTLAATVNHPQSPAYYDGVVGHVYLAGLGAGSAPPSTPPITSVAPPNPCVSAPMHWNSVEAIGTRSAFEDHLRRFPNCDFAELARARIENLKRLAAIPPPSPPDAIPTPAPLRPQSLVPGRTIRVGVAGPMTGPNAAFGLQMKRGAEQAAADLNARGGINGSRIHLVFGDDNSDPREGVAVASRLVKEKVTMVVGHFNSGVSIPASEIYAQNGVLMVSPASTNPRLTDRKLWNTFRVAGRDDHQGVIAAQALLAMPSGIKVAIVHDKTNYGKGLADGTKFAINAGGLREVLYEGVNSGDKDFASLVDRIRAARADIVYWGGLHTEAGLILRQMRQAGLSARMMSGDGIATDEFSAIAGPGAEGTLMTFAPDPQRRPEAASVVKSFLANNFKPEAYTLYAYAALEVLAAAANKANSVSPKAVATTMQSGTPFSTVLGTLNFDSKGDRTQPDYVMYTWKKVGGDKITYVQN